jgi:hypothetical protein
LARALQETAPLWPEVRTAFGWVHRAAQLLKHGTVGGVLGLRREYRGLLAEMLRGRPALSTLAPAVTHFVKVTQSYWRGLFHCYEVPELPHTNNDLEHLFGSTRYHERRASGRRGAVPALVVRGAARVVAAIATRTRRYQAQELRPRDLQAWQQLRTALEARQELRRRQLRFRRDPGRYLAELEAVLLHPSLPT